MQQRASDTRAAILRAAATVFERRGYASATIAEILSEGGVTKGAAYFHFESKEAIARAVIAEQSVWRVEEPPASPVALQRAVNTSYRFAALLQTDVVARASIRLTLERNTFQRRPGEPDQYEAWLDNMRAITNAAYANGELVIAPEPAAHIIVSSFTGTQLVSEVLTNRTDLINRVHALWTVLTPGLITPEYRGQIDLVARV